MSAAKETLKEFYSKIPLWKQVYYKWRSLKGVPFRKKYFVGYDLDGNTYWEFYLERNQKRPRRIVEPIEPQALLFNYFEKVPIQWAQWLKYARHTPPSVYDIVADQERIKRLQILAAFKDSEQQYNRELQQHKVDANLEKELGKLNTPKSNDNDTNALDNGKHAEDAAKAMQRSGYDLNGTIKHTKIKNTANPWAEADGQKNREPEESSVKPSR